MHREREAGLALLFAGVLYGLWPPPAAEGLPWLLWAASSAIALWWLRIPLRHVAEQGEIPRGDPRSQWAAHIAHDLRTPLMRLRLQLADLARDGGEAPTEEALLAMEREILQIERLADDLINLTAGDESWPGAESCDAPLVARETAARVAPLFELQGRALRCEAPDRAPCDAGAVQVGRIIDNLLSNALRYGMEEADVLLSLARDGPFWVRLDVSNRSAAPSVCVAELSRPFVRGVSDEAGKEGFGLGLAVVERLCAVTGGRLRLRHDEGDGRFLAKALLPCARALQQDP